MMSNSLILAAVETERPTPVTIAMYAARHSGHFGKKARIAPGTTHLAVPERRRTKVGESQFLQQAVFISGTLPIRATNFRLSRSSDIHRDT